MLRSEEVALYYQWFLDVEVMVFLGFGFLMTFLRRYSYSAVAFNFFISAFVMIYSVLVIGGVQQVGCRMPSDDCNPAFDLARQQAPGVCLRAHASRVSQETILAGSPHPGSPQARYQLLS